MITVRILDPSEHGRLKDYPYFDEDGVPSPDVARIVVAENEEGKIVAFWSAIAITHLEPLWVDPAYRGTGIFRRMWQRMKQFLDDYRVPMTFSMIEDPQLGRIAEAHGFLKRDTTIYLYCPAHSKEPTHVADDVS
jgi:GNAT superfamily N-acetyltransferase